jgi:hypothetical protein
MSMNRRRRLVGKGKAALVWTLGLFVASQALLGVWFRYCHADMINPTQEFRYARLGKLLAETPGQGLVVVVGSSRSANGFSPHALGDWMPQPPVVFNFATLGGGPVRELLTYRQMIARGIRPDWLLVEIWPCFWSERPGLYYEQAAILRCDSYLSDLPVISRLYGAGWDGFAGVCVKNLTPVIHYRAPLLETYAPDLASRGADNNRNWEKIHWLGLDDWGWLPVGWPRLGPEEFAQKLEHARQVTQPDLEGLAFKPGTDWAIHELLRECREHGSKVALFFNPEHSGLRSWYSPQAWERVQSYFLGLAGEFNVPVIDARDWVPDEGFVDFCHLLPCGADLFSARFGREVLRLLVEGRPLPANVLLRGPEQTPTYDRASPPAGP